jgi:hypothetical protein
MSPAATAAACEMTKRRSGAAASPIASRARVRVARARPPAIRPKTPRTWFSTSARATPLSERSIFAASSGATAAICALAVWRSNGASTSVRSAPSAPPSPATSASARDDSVGGAAAASAAVAPSTGTYS